MLLIFMMSVCLWSYCDVAMVLIVCQQGFGLLLQTQRIHVNTTQNVHAKKAYCSSSAEIWLCISLAA